VQLGSKANAATALKARTEKTLEENIIGTVETKWMRWTVVLELFLYCFLSPNRDECVLRLIACRHMHKSPSP
jgi:hypothetical protein